MVSGVAWQGCMACCGGATFLVREEILKQVERAGELREEHHAVAATEELGQQPLEQLELALQRRRGAGSMGYRGVGCRGAEAQARRRGGAEARRRSSGGTHRAVDELLRVGLVRRRLDAREEEGVVAALAQLHEQRRQLLPVSAGGGGLGVIRLELPREGAGMSCASPCPISCQSGVRVPRVSGARAHERAGARAWSVRVGVQAGVRGVRGARRARRACLSSDDSRSSSRLYQKSCMSESGHVIVVSSLGGIRFSTSPLVRRIIKGRSRWPAAASCALSQVMPLLPELRLNASSKAADLGVQGRGMLQIWRRL